MIKWEYNETIEGTYTGVDLNYTNPDIDDSINVSMGEEGRMYSINVQANSQYDAELQAAAKVNEANRKMETLTLTIRADIRIIATLCVNITGLEAINGKYYVDKVKHSIGSSGYTMQLTLHKVQKPIRVAALAASGAGDGQWYTVVSGDTLWALAKKYYGSGSKYSVIYNANTDTIETTAKEHGKSSSSNGHWIWPGEKLWIPVGG
ncbi:LysM peptidoglycan-binding domain-containing protein [Clostridiaceae bacterium AF42-6]|nr:LysM peptidoglycan-binding domain-containing protein [Clostridiaceae bacterium AF42-6]